MEKIERVGKALARALATVGLGALLCFAVMTMADGMLRFFFASPIDVVRDASGLVAAFAVSACIPVAIVERSNITIRFLSNLFGQRISRIADFAAGLLVEIVLLLITWQFVLFSEQAHERAPRPGCCASRRRLSGPPSRDHGVQRRSAGHSGLQSPVADGPHENPESAV